MYLIKYFWAVLRHKWFVFIECAKLGIPLRGIVHNWTKFLPDEFIPYARYFYGDGKDDDALDVARNLHQKRNSHHWQFWLLTMDDPAKRFTWASYGPVQNDMFQDSIVHKDFWMNTQLWGRESVKSAETFMKHLNAIAPHTLPMPHKDRLEMLADWRGSGKAYGNDSTVEWYRVRKELMAARLHPETKLWVERQLLNDGR